VFRRGGLRVRSVVVPGRIGLIRVGLPLVRVLWAREARGEVIGGAASAMRA